MVLAGVTERCEPPCGSRDLNPGPPEEQPVLITPEPSLEPAPIAAVLEISF